jgi:hypothetical protein
VYAHRRGMVEEDIRIRLHPGDRHNLCVWSDITRAIKLRREMGRACRKYRTFREMRGDFCTESEGTRTL